jgi:hypothetical protein
VAGVAAVLIAAIVITTFALVRAGIHTSTIPGATPSPHAQASPTPLGNQLQVGDTPVILYHDPANFDQLDGVTWDGKTSGRVGLGVTMGGSGNPQGTLYSTDTDLRNRTGKVVDASVANPVFWGDDGTHYCELVRTKARNVTAPGMLVIGEPGQTPRNVVQVGLIPDANLNGGGPSVVACSPLADRAVVYQSGGQGIGVTQFWVIQLSTGKTIWRGGSGGYIAASHDGKYIGLADSNDHSAIYGPNGDVLTHVQGTLFAFSWDGDFAVVGAFNGTPSIIYWISGQLTIWTCPPGIAYTYWQAFPEPGGTRIAIGAVDPAHKNTNGFQPVDLFVVDTHNAVGAPAGFEKKDVTLFQY